METWWRLRHTFIIVEVLADEYFSDLLPVFALNNVIWGVEGCPLDLVPTEPHHPEVVILIT